MCAAALKLGENRWGMDPDELDLPSVQLEIV
jgi:hypothetical protein